MSILHFEYAGQSTNLGQFHVFDPSTSELPLSPLVVNHLISDQKKRNSSSTPEFVNRIRIITSSLEYAY